MDIVKYLVFEETVVLEMVKRDNVFLTSVYTCFMYESSILFLSQSKAFN